MFKLNYVDLSWQSILKNALPTMDQSYLAELIANSNWLPGKEKIFNAFSLPLQKVNYILFGESPYPRRESANGFAFWDAAVNNLWSNTGLSREVNRATSLRNFIKMLLVADNKLSSQETSQEKIACINKIHLIKTIDELFSHLIQHGFLLLNATLVWRSKQVRLDSKNWQPFMNDLLLHLHQERPNVQVILLGKFAEKLKALPAISLFKQIQMEHPYNISFITNPEAIKFFKSFQLLSKTN